MPLVVPFVATLLVVLCPFFVPRDSASAWIARTCLLLAVPLAYVALLFAYVFGEDSYRGNGISRWDAYRSPSGALEPMFWATVALMVLAVGSMVLAIVQRRIAEIGGVVELTSPVEAGHGTRFRLVIPLPESTTEDPNETHRRPAETESLAGKK